MQTWFRYLLRLPPELHILLKSAAEESGRSLNSEICYRLKASFNSYRR